MYAFCAIPQAMMTLYNNLVYSNLLRITGLNLSMEYAGIAVFGPLGIGITN